MKIPLAYLVVIIILTNSACSVYKAATQPPPADLTGMSVGTQRVEVINRFGVPMFSATDPAGNKQDTFKFESGLHQGSKARIIPYLVADLFTLGLAEPLLWTMELTVMERATCIANVSYDESQKVEHWVVYKKASLQAQGC